MSFYAHTVAGRPEDDWEPLRHHLEEVGALAAARADRFGSTDIARAAGLLHDLGKYSRAFQDRLHGAKGSVDHSTAGAVWAKANLDPTWGRMVAHTVAGHHAGLADGLFDPGGRLEEKAEMGAPAAHAAMVDGLALPRNLAPPDGMKFIMGQGGFQRAFLTRMISPV